MSKSRMFALFISLVSLGSNASPPIESVVIDDDVAKSLGFITSVETDEEATTLNLTGPSEINGCTAQRAGNFITDSGKDISGYVGNVSKENSPSILGYVRNGKDVKMIVFIDYICPNRRNSESRRYELWSTRT